MKPEEGRREDSRGVGGATDARPAPPESPPARKHKYLLFEATRGCQNDCLFCYNVWKEDAAYPPGELSLDQTLMLLGRAIDQTGCKHIGVTGGEPLLRHGIFEVLSLMASRGVEPVLISNGALLDEDAVRRCLDCGVKYFEVSLHSNRPEIHDKLAGRVGSFEEVIDAATVVKRLGAHVTTVFVATKENIRTFKETVELNALLGAEWMLFNRIACGGTCVSTWRDLVPTPGEIGEALEAGAPVAAKYRVGLSAGVQIQPCLVDLSKYEKVYSGFCPLNDPQSEGSYFAIDPAGNLRMCNRSKIVLGNLLERPFAQAAGSEAVAKFSRAIPDFCLDCKFAAACAGGCKADALSAFGDLARPDPYIELFKDQVKKFQ
jgi:radical SAM protein with 4Fe4S-binding SPASM domain